MTKKARKNLVQKNSKKCQTMRIDKEFNQRLIRDAYQTVLAEKRGRKPTIKEIAEKTGLSMKAVHNHFQELKFEPSKSSVRILTDDMLLAIFRAGMKGSALSQKLWFQVVEGWVEKHKMDIKKGLEIDDSINPMDAQQHYFSVLDE